MTRLGARWVGALSNRWMVEPHVPFENFDVLTATDFPDQIWHTVVDLSRQDRLAILRGEHVSGQSLVPMPSGVSREGTGRGGAAFATLRRPAVALAEAGGPAAK